MSAEILRRAAQTARDEWAGETTGPFKNAARIHLAVADLLEQTAWRCENSPIAKSNVTPALAVARAYLGEPG